MGNGVIFEVIMVANEDQEVNIDYLYPKTIVLLVFCSFQEMLFVAIMMYM